MHAETISNSSNNNPADSPIPFQPEDAPTGVVEAAETSQSTPIKSWSHRLFNPTDNDFEERKKDNWLNWMMRGRGTDKIIMREAEELGGLPRGDRYSSKDWFHIAITMPNSGILRSIRSPVIAMTSWATFLSLLHDKLLHINPVRAEHWYLPTTPHSLMMSALGIITRISDQLGLSKICGRQKNLGRHREYCERFFQDADVIRHSNWSRQATEDPKIASGFSVSTPTSHSTKFGCHATS